MLSPLEVDVAEDGRQAANLLADHHYDVILCDVMMPKMTGLALYEEISRKYPGVEERFVFMTGGVSLAEAQSITELPNACLEKPFSRDEVFDAIRALMDREDRSSSPHNPPSV